MPFRHSDPGAIDRREVTGRAAMAGSVPLSKNAYKLPIFETLVRRAIMAAAQA